jgi:hypothetical protein
MARNTTTPAPAPVAVLEEEVIVAEEETPLEAATDHLVRALDGRGVIFASCEESYKAIQAGIDPKELAEKVTEAIIARDYSDNPKGVLAQAARKKSVVEGGASITGAAILNRSRAWALVVYAGVEPTPELIATAFKLVSVGRGRTIADEQIKPESAAFEGTAEEKAVWFAKRLEEGRMKMRSTSPRSAANRNAWDAEKILATLQKWGEGENIIAALPLADRVKIEDALSTLASSIVLTDEAAE